MAVLSIAKRASPLVIAAAVLCLAACVVKTEMAHETRLRTNRQTFGSVDGRTFDLYTLSNPGRFEAAVTNYGGIVTSLKVPDRNGVLADIVLGFDSAAGYLKPHPYFGALIGRYANRIAGGRFRLDGVEYTLARNNGENHLHGGVRGFDKVVWNARDVSSGRAAILELSYSSKDGEEGYPGNLDVTVRYSVTEGNELKIEYTATTDKDTILNLTNHSYFNLAGQGGTDVLSHEVKLDADRFTPVNSGLIPTGETRDVAGTPFDFRQPHRIGERIDLPDEQLKLGNGYDHNFVVTGTPGVLRPAARVTDSASGRVMEVLTTEPGVQLYTGNFLDGSLTGKSGKIYLRRYGLCLETQHFPDSPNKPQFPSVVLKPGQTFRSTTIYRFSTR
jgi:aldose 1-epimerase